MRPKCVGNMDETPLWFDLPSTDTYDFQGIRSVKSKTTGHEKAPLYSSIGRNGIWTEVESNVDISEL